MSTGTTIGIAVGVIVVFAAAFVLATARRRDRDAAVGRLGRETVARDRSEAVAEPVLGEFEAAARLSGREVERAAALERHQREVVLPATVTAPRPPAVPLDPETLGVTRRQFLNRGAILGMGVTLTGFGASLLAFLWPNLTGGFGSKIRAGTADEINAYLRDKKQPFYVPEGRFYINPYPKDAVPKASRISSYAPVLPGYKAGFVALYQRCVHLGCRVPWCQTSQWFECPCHGSQYNRVGEKKGGPAPRGLDRFVLTVDGGQVVVDTKQKVDGPVIGTNTTGQEAEGPHCIGGRAE